LNKTGSNYVPSPTLVFLKLNHRHEGGFLVPLDKKDISPIIEEALILNKKYPIKG